MGAREQQEVNFEQLAWKHGIRKQRYRDDTTAKTMDKAGHSKADDGHKRAPTEMTAKGRHKQNNLQEAKEANAFF